MKIINYLKNPLLLTTTIRVKINKFVLKKRVEQFKKHYPNEYNAFKKSIEKYRAGGGFEYDLNFQLLKLIEIFEFLKKHEIKTILELGTGSTTTAINQYLLKNEGTSAICLDESEYWIINTALLLSGNNNVSKNLKLQHANRIIESEDPVISRYDFDYSLNHNFDLVIIDGPSTIYKENSSADNWNSDFLALSVYQLPQWVLIDNRKSTYKNSIAKLGENYSVKETFIWHNTKKIYTGNTINFYTQLTKKSNNLSSQRKLVI